MKTNRLLIILLASFFFSFFTTFNNIRAESVSSADFEVRVGNDGWINATHIEVTNEEYYANKEDKSTRYYRYFMVEVNPSIEVDPSLNENLLPQFKWIHQMCFIVDGIENGCVYDEVFDYKESSGGVEVSKKITPNSSFKSYYYDENEDKVPYYYVGDQTSISVTFKNQFICIENCQNYPNTDQLLADVFLVVDEETPIIDNENTYLPDNSLNGEIVGSSIELFINYEDTQSGIDNTRYKYLWTTKISVNIDEITNSYQNGQVIYFKPPITTIAYSDSFYVTYYFFIIVFDNAGNQTYEARGYNFSINYPTIQIAQIGELPDNETYFKSANVSFTLSDSSVLPDSLKYTWSYSSYVGVNLIATPYVQGNNISLNQSFSTIAYLYVIGYDSEGNIYRLVRKYNFDFTKPTILDVSNLDTNLTYKNLTFEVGFQDSGSGIDESKKYYLWTNQVISDYTLINNQLTSNLIVSPTNLNGEWRIYLLSYDKVGNFDYGYRLYKFDNLPPSIASEISLLDNNEFSALHQVYLDVADVVNDSLKCEWIKEGVAVNDILLLNKTCINKTYFSASKNLEGQYRLWIYAEDSIGNGAFLSTSNIYLIDTTNPTLNYQIQDNNLTYLSTNKVTLSFSDFSNIDQNSLKYGWFLKNLTINNSSLLANKFSNDEEIDYPFNYYGIYHLWVCAKDSLGNEYFSFVNEEFYIDSAIITLTLKGDQTMNILKGQVFVDPGVTSLKGDLLQGGRSVDYIVSGSVDYNKVGTYYLTYTSGSGSNQISVTRTVIVSDNLYYYLGGSLLLILGGGVYILQIKKKNNVLIDEEE